MKPALLEELVPQVKRNCLISDARFWGRYSLCGLLLRLRELYRFEKGLDAGEGVDREDVSRWIGSTEALWEEMRDREFSPISVGSRVFGPFNAEGVNSAINGHGLLYGAGYGIFLKPVFFLADLDAEETAGGLKVYTAGKEYARDLSLHPAMLQDGTIIARKHAAHVLIAEKFEEFRAMKKGGALALAFSSYGIDGGSKPGDLRRMADAELRTFISHEMGEAFETGRMGPEWTGMLASLAAGKASVYLRSVKDVLADASEEGTLRHIIAHEKTGSLAFHVASLSGFRKALAAPIEDAFHEFTRTGRWEEMETARGQCYERTKAIADELLATYIEGRRPEAVTLAMEKHIARA